MKKNLLKNFQFLFTLVHLIFPYQYSLIPIVSLLWNLKNWEVHSWLIFKISVFHNFSELGKTWKWPTFENLNYPSLSWIWENWEVQPRVTWWFNFQISQYLIYFIRKINVSKDWDRHSKISILSLWMNWKEKVGSYLK